MNVILLGSPGAGKGTIGQMIAEEEQIPLFSTGDLLRKEVADNTDIGIKAKSFMDKGDYVPDNIVVDIIRNRIVGLKGFILDGFPRTVAQVNSLESARIKIDVVLNFVVSTSVIVDRLATRLTCRNCAAIYNIKNVPPKKPGICDRCGGELYQRDDQTPEAIRERVRVYERETKPLVDYYRKAGLLRDIDANPSDPDVIYKEALELIRLS
ncbi:MAG: nucleoside monophosphate kinase [Candidatus Woesearchaeota archaeon]